MVLYQKPISFAIAGLVEVLGWWAFKGVTLNVVFRAELEKGQTLLQNVWSQSPRLAFASHIIETLLAGETAPPKQMIDKFKNMQCCFHRVNFPRAVGCIMLLLIFSFSCYLT
jgi:hypothetical protein